MNRTRRIRFRLSISGALRRLLPVLCLLLPVAAVATDEAPLHSYRAGSDLEIQLFEDGSFRFVDTATGQVLVDGLPAERSGWAQRARTDAPTFTARAPEGVAGGRRGEPSRADDDEDDRIDEDPLDGRDNDGDGRIDEDFAAISDAMVVVDADGGARRAEFYHWAYPHLASALFFRLSGESDPAQREDYRIELPLGEWIEAPVTHRRHSLVGRALVEEHTALVAKLDYPGVQEDGRWVGVLPLGEWNPGGGGSAVQKDEGVQKDPAVRSRLDLLHAGDRDFVVCLADSWLQLNRVLCDAVRVEQGMTDPVSGRATPWVVPPACPICRQAESPEFEFTLTAEDELLLEMHIDEDSAGVPDPDLFTLGGVDPGSPVELVWRPAEGPAHIVRWTAMTPALLVDPVPELSDPYEEGPCRHGAEGAVTLKFVLPEEAALRIRSGIPSDGTTSLELRGRWMDGRLLSEVATGRIETASDPVAETATGDLEPVRDLDSDPDRLSLAANLLSGFPNPFRDVIQVRFHVPQTVGEAFEPDDDEGWPEDLDLRAPVPWRSGTPFVTVKIYRINGQELVTLYEDYLGPNQMTVHWDGMDGYGRPAASGTYFCKLQMDEWSVTKPIIYLR